MTATSSPSTCAVLIGPTGTGKSHLLTALGYAACEHGHTVRHTRVVDLINHLTTAQINGLLGKALKHYTRPDLLLLDELVYLPIDKRGADLLFQVVAARYKTDRSCSPRIDPSGNGAPCSTSTTLWPRP